MSHDTTEMPREAHLGEELPRAGGGCCGGQGQCGCGGHEKGDHQHEAQQDKPGCHCDGSGTCGCTDGRCSCGAAECRCCRNTDEAPQTGSCCGGHR